jgi:TRAP-type C4-dicarboxylate transport system permease small subunit
MKNRLGVVLACLAMLAIFLTGGVPVVAAEYSDTVDAVGAGMIILAGVLTGLAIALIVIRIMAAKMNPVRKQDSAKGYGQKLILTDKSDVFLYSRTTSRVDS